MVTASGCWNVGNNGGRLDQLNLCGKIHRFSPFERQFPTGFRLFTDAEIGENFTEKIITGELTGNCPKGFLGKA